MTAINRSPRILIKLPAAPPQASFNFANKPLTVGFERLFHSIRPSAPEWHVMSAGEPGPEVNAWDLCHHLVRSGFGISGLPAAHFAEPDLEQQWTTGTPVQHALSAARSGPQPAGPDLRLPAGSGFFWFRDPAHSQLEAARTVVGQPSNRVRIAHFDTGYDPHHLALPPFLRRDLQKNFVDGNSPDDAADRTSGILTNLGHGTGTLSLLAGAAVDGTPLGGAPFLDIIPVRVANSVVLFRNSSIARAFDYVHGLFDDTGKRAHVISMSMGGLASQAWTDAVNALYDLGVFIVTAAGNNFGNLPVRNIVYPARYNRVVAACGVMADGRPYADLPLNIMAGNYGPEGKMATALAGFTPNTPWARLGGGGIVDRDGRGTSAATPQVAAAAALWIQKFQGEWENYADGWQRVEAVRKALFNSARLDSQGSGKWLGRGAIQAASALSQQPAAASSLQKQPLDLAGFPFLRILTGLGLTAAPDVPHSMLELEALQLTQRSQELERLLPDPENPGELSAADRRRVVELLHDAPGASKALRSVLGRPASPVVMARPPAAGRLQRAMDPLMPQPPSRKLRVFAFDPLLGYNPDSVHINQTTLEVDWEELQPGPAGEYLEVVDVDPATGCAYAPVDLNHLFALSQEGLPPSESSPRFHQQMVYAVAMRTISHFERALGRVALWAPRLVQYERNGATEVESHYVQRLRIYPHAIREANSFYSREKKALLLGYFPASDSGENLPGGTVFCCLSHDIVAHETTHALLDGLHPYFGEPANADALAFHEAFADIVALFQHFTVPEALRDQIAKTRGDLSKPNILGQLAQQFGQGIGRFGALRSALGQFDADNQWTPARPTRNDYENASEPHDRGAVLVAAVFDAFLNVYARRSADVIRLSTGGSGLLPEGQLRDDLANRLAQEASRTAAKVLNICIRALDYCPPVDLMFGEYLRALITADRDLAPDDPWGYRPAFIQGCRRRGIYPESVRNLSPESLCWEKPENQLPLDGLFKELQLDWDLRLDRKKAFDLSRLNAAAVHRWLMTDPDIGDADTESLGFYRGEGATLTVNGKPGALSPFEVHSVRPVRRIGPGGQQSTDLVIEITQSWRPSDGSGKFRGGCTLIVDLEKRVIRYVVRKRVGHPERVMAQGSFRAELAKASLGVNYFSESALTREPFALLHRGM